MLTPGARLGSYEIVGPLGAGGMGEVWRVRDARLGREVAIKVLPEAVAGDPARVARFEREAKLLASLNHPGIATVHGFEQVDGVSMLVQELVEGLTLAERLRRGALPMREALELAVLIAEALEAAHEKGIVHRDLKPSNVKLTADGRVKVLDFGLAKALGTESAVADVSKLTTDTSPTGAGVILGTAPYMSPEQARGEGVDERTDIWAFGCVLYEMLTGGRAFRGATGSDVIAAIIERQPDWKALPTGTPPLVGSVLRRCLQKDRSRRLHAIADARLEIEEALTWAGSQAAAGPAWSRSSARRALLMILGVLAAAGTSWLWTRSPRPGHQAPTRFNIDVAASTQLPLETVTAPIAISPDGRQLAYQAEGQGLYVRALDQAKARRIPGTESASQPFFSPDGQWLGCVADGKLLRVPLGGGSPRVIAEAPQPRGASWADDGTIVYTPHTLSGLFRVSSEGGAPSTLTEPDPSQETSHRWPQVLPGAHAVLFTTHPPSGRIDESRIAALSLKTGDRKILVQGGIYGRYVPTGHLVFVSGGSMFAAPFDVGKLELIGPAVAVLDDVRMAWGSGAAHFDFSRAGTAMYVAPHQRPGEAALQWVDRKGAAAPVTSTRRAFRAPRLSPDGRRLAVHVQEPNGMDLWLLEIARQAWSRLTFAKDNAWPVWSPDGARIAFTSNRNGYYNLYLVAADGGGVERLTTSVSWHFPTSWSPDGRVLVFEGSNPDTEFDVWEVPVDGGRRPRPLVVAPLAQNEARFSPDGRWLAYESAESGRAEVYVRAYGGSDRRWTISTEGGSAPLWSHMGREIVYTNGTKILAVPVATTPTFKAGVPAVLFDRGKRVHGYDVTPDGQRFVIAEDAEPEPERLQIVVIPDWFEELKAKVPVPRR
jgi:serine/threonine protein kinase